MVEPGPVEGWIVASKKLIGIVKGCEQPLPGLHYVPRVVEGRRVPKDPDDLCSYVECRFSRCTGRRVPIAFGDYVISPFDALQGVKGCDTRVCRAALELLDHLASAGVELAGVTGSLAYRPGRARDVDVVVYGLRDGYRAYRALMDMRRDGISQPLNSPDTGWEPSVASTVSGRLLLGVYRGNIYSVRIVKCVSPLPCTPSRPLGRVKVCGRLVHVEEPWLTPTVYRIVGDGAATYILTYRLRYAELPQGVRVCVKGILEESCGLKRVVPDVGGSVEVLGVDESS